MTDIQSFTRANRIGWNQIAGDRPGQPASFFIAGGSALEDFELRLAGDVAGRRILQLACSCGDEALSWAALGATVTAIDISEVAIDLARRKSSETGIPVDFRQADIFDLPSELTSFDLIHFSWGAICWVPDLDLFARILAHRLRPGGAGLLSEHHPLWEVLAVRGTNRLSVSGDYFGRTTPRAETDNAKLPVGARDTATPPSFASFVWPVSDVVTALLRAGLQLDTFFEAPALDIYPTLGPVAAQLPAYYVIRATADVSHETSTANP